MTTLREYLDAWQATCEDLVALVSGLEPADWQRATDLPAWSVQDVFAHVTALESELAGDPRPRVQVDTSLPHISSKADVYTERGVLAGRQKAPEELMEQFRDAVERRAAQLADEPLDDPAGQPPRTPGDIGWDWETLLRNRVVDMWVHEQDIRRAVGRAGDLDTAGARVTQGTFAAALPFLVAKRAGGVPGMTVVIHVTGPVVATYSVIVDDDGRGAVATSTPEEPTLQLSMSTEAFTILGAGRRPAGTCDIAIEGDHDLAQRLLASMALTI